MVFQTINKKLLELGPSLGFLHCPFYTQIRNTLLDNIAYIMGIPLTLTDDNLIRLILYGDDNLSTKLNASNLKNTIIFLKTSERFDGPLF